MKCFVIVGAYQDEIAGMDLTTPEIFKSRYEAENRLKELFDNCKNCLNSEIDSDLDLELGTADIYRDDDYHELYNIVELELKED